MWRRDEGATASLARRIVELRYEDIPDEVIEAAKILCLDGLGNMLAGARQPIGIVLANFLKGNAAAKESTAIGMGVKTADYLAALANGSTCRSMDFDPESPGHHPCGPSLPPALALAEKLGKDGRSLLGAFAIGVEVQVRVDEAGRGDPTAAVVTKTGRGPVGALSAAAVSAKLMGFDQLKTQHAFGLGAARTGGIDSTGTMASPGDSGHVASMGVLYARLASQGFTGRENAIEEPHGFKQFLGDKADVDGMARHFANPWAVLKQNIRLKRHNCQFPAHPTIDAILDLYSQKPWKPDEVAAVEVKVMLLEEDCNWNYYNVHNLSPRSGMDGRFSVAYTAAVTVLDGKLTIDSYSDEKRFSPEVVEMLGKVKLSFFEERSKGHVDQTSEVTIRFTDGSSRMARAVGRNPIATEEQRLGKFMDCAQRAISRRDAERVIELVARLGKLPDLAEFFRLLRGQPAK